MLTLLMTILMIAVCWKLLKFSVRAGFGILKVILSIFLTVLLIGLVLAGIAVIALPLLIVGVIVYLATRSNA